MSDWKEERGWIETFLLSFLSLPSADHRSSNASMRVIFTTDEGKKHLHQKPATTSPSRWGSSEAGVTTIRDAISAFLSLTKETSLWTGAGRGRRGNCLQIFLDQSKFPVAKDANLTVIQEIPRSPSRSSDSLGRLNRTQKTVILTITV